MRKKLPLLFGAAFLALGMVACEGPAGPAGQDGAQGAQGEQGVQGPAGAPGQDALNTCSDCHTSDMTIVAREEQYNTSAHGSGDTYERYTNPCNTCHTHNGFVAANDPTNPDTLEAGDIHDLARINCRTCHEVHTTYTDDDWTLTATDPVNLYVGGGTFDIADLSETPAVDEMAFSGANLCAHCHQARDPGDLSGATFNVGSTHFGMHHGPQANVMSGQGAYDLTGATMPAPTSFTAHAAYGCVGCHMQDAVGDAAGGHTWRIKVDDTTILNDGRCDGMCHTGTPYNSYSLQTGIQALLDSVAIELQTQGMLDSTNTVITGDHPTDDVKAFLNYDMILEDRSLGVHNPHWAEDVLKTTLTWLRSDN